MTPDGFATAKAVLDTVHYGTLATASLHAQPWNSPVVMVFDAGLNFYWFSARHSQHAQNIASNPHSFIVFYDSTVKPFVAHIDRGLYVQGESAEATECAEVERALSLKAALGGGHNDPAGYLGEAPRRVYRTTPKRLWLNDIALDAAGRFLYDNRTELDLDKFREFLAAY